MLPVRPASARLEVRSRRTLQTRLRVELLEDRATPSVTVGDPLGEFHPVIVAGDPNGSPADSPSKRVIDNTDLNSPFAGVGSVQVNARRGTYIGTGTPIGKRHILTAGHVVDINGDGKFNSKDGVQSTYFILNYGGNQTHKLLVSSVAVNPDYTGFNRPSVNDDVAVLTLASDLPTGVPIYGLPSADLAAGTTLTMVGYGRSGDGVNGYTTNASWTIKRKGENNADDFYTQDDSGKSAANEVFRFDFDGPTGTGTWGGGTLGNDRETQLGGGDSGGPSFVPNGTGYTVVGVNTFTQGSNTPLFGSLGGGMNVYAYRAWIDSVLTTGTSGTTGGGSTGGGSGDGGNGMSQLMPEQTVAWTTTTTPTAVTVVAPPADRTEEEYEAAQAGDEAEIEFQGGVSADAEPAAADLTVRREGADGLFEFPTDEE